MKTIPVTCLFVLLATGTATADYKDWNKYFSGSWTFEDGSVQQEFKLAIGGEAVVGTATATDGEESLWVIGWDPGEDVLITQWFGRNHGRVKFKIVDDQTLRGPGTINGPGQFTKGMVTVKKEDNATYDVRWTEVRSNGNKADDFGVVVKRK